MAENHNFANSKKIAYFSGCFANYYYPEVGSAVMAIMHENAIKVVVPNQVCCGLPMIAKGNAKDAIANMKFNVKELAKLVKEGFLVAVSCSSCGLFLKRDLPHFLQTKEAELVSANLFHITEYLLNLSKVSELNMKFRRIDQSIFYHQPCHLRAQQIGNPSVTLIEKIPGIKIIKVSEVCCGMSGAYGYEKQNYALSKDIASKLYKEIQENPADRFITDCGGCRLQIQGGTNKPVEHPVILLKEAWMI